MKSNTQLNENVTTPSRLNGSLQRKCSCGKSDSLGGDCRECKKKKSLFQRKLTIGSSNDPLEVEADRVASQVVSMSTNAKPLMSSTPIKIQKKSIQSGTESIAPQSVERAVASTGIPMGSQITKEMQHYFNYDFSKVRLHVGSSAERSARDVNANAYTLGNHIVFGTGQYAPETHRGKKLLAHELTHVVQQGEASNISHNSQIQREVTNQISTIEDRLTYNILDWAITDSNAHDVIIILKRLNDTDLADTIAYMEQRGWVDRLFENVSEVDQTAEVSTLERIHRLRVHTRTTRSGSNEVTSTVVGPCNQEQMQTILSKIQTAKNWARRAKNRVNNFISRPANNVPVQSLLDRYFFHQSSAGNLTVAQQQTHARQISRNLETVEQQNNPFSQYCASQFDLTCRAMAAAYVSSSTRRITYCNSFFSSSSNWQSFALFHELMHAYSGVDDRGYGNERIFAYLSPANAINNADSYALFVVELLNEVGGARGVRSPAPNDSYADCNANQQNILRRDFAFASRMVLNSLNVLPSTPRIGSAEALAHFKTDQPSQLAQVIKRLKKLDTEISSRINFECEDSCDSGTAGYYYSVFGNTAHICPAYFRIASNSDREDNIFAIVAMEELGLSSFIRPGEGNYATLSRAQAYDNAGSYTGYARAVTSRWWA
ncbi:eCIS core domain-containing protein [Aliikangiella sp. IMCC44359]|uniref:eCIS core domain-containing protein n=1 Tax=Aliikangiella sp. IMCC44359 TaxID=3459125 RepID=UPI00403B2767